MVGERHKVLAYLEEIQRRTYEFLEIEPDWMSARRVAFNEEFLRRFYDSPIRRPSQTFEEFREWALKELQGCPEVPISAYQDPAWYSLLAGMAKEIEEVLAERNMGLNPSPIFGSLPTGRVNGVALKVPDTDQVIVLIEDGLFGFANLAAKAVARLFPFKGDEDGRLIFSTASSDWQLQFTAKPEVSERFLELILAYILGGHPHKAKAYLPDANYEVVSSVLCGSMELFVLGHEYGHFVCGHLNEGSTRKAMIGGEDSDKIATNWQQEFEADVRGLEYMLAVMGKRGFDLSLSFWGADFFFCCIDIVEKAVSTIRTGSSDVHLSSTHPPTNMRRELLHSVLKNSVPEEHAAGPLQLAGIVKSILDQLWLVCEPVLVRAHQDGVELAPAWR